MLYHSTRDIRLTAPSTRAVLEGIAPDGGLYICDPARLDFDWQGALQLDTMFPHSWIFISNVTWKTEH